MLRFFLYFFLCLPFCVLYGASEYGLFLGSLFGLLLAGTLGVLGLLLLAVARWRMASFPWEPGEQIVREGPANYYHGPMAHGGWLVLTNRRLVFRPHFFNLRWADTQLHVGQIAAAEAARTLWVLPNKLKVSSERDDHHFVVEQSPAWVADIDAQR